MQPSGFIVFVLLALCARAEAISALPKSEEQGYVGFGSARSWLSFLVIPLFNVGDTR